MNAFQLLPRNLLYRLAALPPGSYLLTASAPTFSNALAVGVQVNVGSSSVRLAHWKARSGVDATSPVRGSGPPLTPARR